MTSTWLMWLIIAEYLAIVVASAWERNWLRCLYYTGAILISIAVLLMTERQKGTS